MERQGVKDLLKTMAGDESREIENSSSAEEGASSKTGESIFSQLLQRLQTGRGVQLGDEVEGKGSLEILLENSIDPMLLLTPIGVVVEANPAFCQAYGWAPEALVGSSLLSIIPEGQWPSFFEKLGGLGSPDRSAPVEFSNDYLEFKARTKNGAVYGPAANAGSSRSCATSLWIETTSSS